MPRSWTSSVPAIALLAALAAAVGWSFWGHSYDDAFITYRYARVWAGTGQLAYNPGEAVLGTTAPGYALLLGALARLTGLSVPAWGTLLALVSLLAVALVTRLALRESPPWVREGVPLLFGAASLLFRWNVEVFGAEQFPVLALGTAAAWLALGSGRQLAAGLLVSAAMICRLDAALLAGVLGLALWWKERRFPLRFALAGLLPAGIFLLLLQGWFGTVIPNTMAAKQSELGMGHGSYTLQEWAWLRRDLPLASCLALLALAAAGAVAGALGVRRRGFAAASLAWAAALWVLVHEIAYRLLRVPFAPWYHVYLVNGLLLLAAFGAVALAFRLPRALQPAAAAALLLPVLLPSVLFVRDFWGRPPDPRWDGYMAAGRHVREQDPSGTATVAAVEIGFLGWASEARVLDLMGLVSPAALAARERGDLPGLVARARPEYIVDATLFRDPHLDPILRHSGIAGKYREVASFPDGRDPGLRVRLLRRSP